MLCSICEQDERCLGPLVAALAPLAGPEGHRLVAARSRPAVLLHGPEAGETGRLIVEAAAERVRVRYGYERTQADRQTDRQMDRDRLKDGRVDGQVLSARAHEGGGMERRRAGGGGGGMARSFIRAYGARLECILRESLRIASCTWYADRSTSCGIFHVLRIYM